MIAWQSMFSGGPCTVSVSELFSTQPDNVLWSGTLARGQQSPTFVSSGGWTLFASVDANGVVSLTSISAILPSIGLALVVTPQYDVSKAAVQMLNPSGPMDTTTAWNAANNAVSPPISVTYTAPNWNPNPVAFAPLSNAYLSLWNKQG